MSNQDIFFGYCHSDSDGNDDCQPPRFIKVIIDENVAASYLRKIDLARSIHRVDENFRCLKFRDTHVLWHWSSNNQETDAESGETPADVSSCVVIVGTDGIEWEAYHEESDSTVRSDAVMAQNLRRFLEKGSLYEKDESEV